MELKGTCFVVECRTGCTCCNYENHYRGPFSNREAAEAAVKTFQDYKIIASQYAPNGSYSISEHSCELLPDGRLIVAERFVYPEFVDGNPMADESVMDGFNG